MTHQLAIFIFLKNNQLNMIVLEGNWLWKLTYPSFIIIFHWSIISIFLCCFSTENWDSIFYRVPYLFIIYASSHNPDYVHIVQLFCRVIKHDNICRRILHSESNKGTYRKQHFSHCVQIWQDWLATHIGVPKYWQTRISKSVIPPTNSFGP
jgi:hypothetical protein